MFNSVKKTAFVEDTFLKMNPFERKRTEKESIH
jgi:hypothetical protein